MPDNLTISRASNDSKKKTTFFDSFVILLLTMSKFSCMPIFFDCADLSFFLTTSPNYVSNFKVPLGTPVEFEMYLTLEDCDSGPQVWALPNLILFGAQASPPLMMLKQK